MAVVPEFYFTRFPMSSRDLRDELIQRMDNISHWSRANEPGVRKYALVVPRDSDDDKTAYSIEQYDDDPTFKAHLAADIVQSTLFDWTGGMPSVFGDKVEVRHFILLDDINFTKRELAEAEDPYIVVQTLSYEDDMAKKALQYWSRVVTQLTDEDGVLAFGVYKDKTDFNLLYTLAAYESKEAYFSLHAPDAAVGQMEEKTQNGRIRTETTPLEKRGGFLIKETKV